VAICPDCQHDINEIKSCVRQHFKLGNRKIPRIPYGDERRPALPYSYNDYCDDCGVETGGYHHRDCAIEQCPLCGDYTAVCHCWRHTR
jgi:site-specific DNA recombinase